MIETVKEILSNSLEDIFKSSKLTLKLLGCYSKLYAGCQQVRECTNSQRQYYAELQKTGIMKATELENTKKRTCEPNWVGIKYFPKTGQHISSTLISDEQAIEHLVNNTLSETDFKILPQAYSSKNHKDVIVLENKPTIEQVKEAVKTVKKGKK